MVLDAWNICPMILSIFIALFIGFTQYSFILVFIAWTNQSVCVQDMTHWRRSTRILYVDDIDIIAYCLILISVLVVFK